MATNEFVGRHSETGTVINALAAMGAVAPHTGKPYSEALALGMGGGIAFGYFTFEYKGWLPHVALLTRNTFSPMDRMLDNLAIKRQLRTTTDDARAEELAKQELDTGNTVVVWADVFSLPHKGLERCDGMWAMMPLLLIGYGSDGFLTIDGSRFPITVSFQDLLNARSRVKKDRNRFMVLEKPETERLAEGVESALKGCLALYLDKPPAGSPKNFGLLAMEHWSEMLVNEKNKSSWTRVFPPGKSFFQAVAGGLSQPGVWDWIESWASEGGADRGLFADFLVEAAAITGNAALRGCGTGFRKAAKLWTALAEAALPDDVPYFAKAKKLKARRRDLAYQGGQEASEELRQVRAEIKALAESVTHTFPVDAVIHARIRNDMRTTLEEIREIEGAAVQTLASVVRTR